jgi:hypothetical protein
MMDYTPAYNAGSAAKRMAQAAGRGVPALGATSSKVMGVRSRFMGKGREPCTSMHQRAPACTSMQTWLARLRATAPCSTCCCAT